MTVREMIEIFFFFCVERGFRLRGEREKQRGTQRNRREIHVGREFRDGWTGQREREGERTATTMSTITN